MPANIADYDLALLPVPVEGYANGVPGVESRPLANVFDQRVPLARHPRRIRLFELRDCRLTLVTLVPPAAGFLDGLVEVSHSQATHFGRVVCVGQPLQCFPHLPGIDKWIFVYVGLGVRCEQQLLAVTAPGHLDGIIHAAHLWLRFFHFLHRAVYCRPVRHSPGFLPFLAAEQLGFQRLDFVLQVLIRRAESV